MWESIKAWGKAARGAAATTFRPTLEVEKLQGWVEVMTMAVTLLIPSVVAAVGILMPDLRWMATVLAPSLFAALAFWAAVRLQKQLNDLRGPLLPHNRDQLVSAVFDVEQTAMEYLRKHRFARLIPHPEYHGDDPRFQPDVREAWEAFSGAYSLFERQLKIADEERFAGLLIPMIFLRSNMLLVNSADSKSMSNDALGRAESTIKSQTKAAQRMLNRGIPPV